MTAALTYVDTSALLKLLITERESEALRAVVDAGVRLVSCELTITELLRNALRAGVADDQATLLLDTVPLVVLDAELLARAGRLPSPSGTFLRSADAVHVAAAMEVGAADFLTYDRRQGAAAALSGLRVIAPG